MQPSEALQQRVDELLRRSGEGTISPDEQSELDECIHLEHIMVMAKARARLKAQLG